MANPKWKLNETKYFTSPPLKLSVTKVIERKVTSLVTTSEKFKVNI